MIYGMIIYMLSLIKLGDILIFINSLTVMSCTLFAHFIF